MSAVSQLGKYQPYPEYKDSGIEWLGFVPSEWSVSSFRHAFKAIKNGSTATQVDENEGTLPISRIETISKGCIDFSKTGFVECNPAISSYKLNFGDILFSHINSLAMIGNVAQYHSSDILYHGMNLLRISPSSRVDSRYLLWWLRSNFARNTVESLAKPAINQASIAIDQIKGMICLYPDIDSQRNIAAFLDYETARIDQLIAKQQQLIELLKEKRQAVISHAVTKGLNPNAQMKDSGVEWLGQVPEHWVVRRLKHTAMIQSGIPKGKDLQGKATISVPMLRVANVQDGYLKLTDVHEIEIEPHELNRYALKKGDVLMNEGGDNDKLGRGAVWNGEITPCIHQNHVFAIRVNGIEPDWLSFLTSSSYAKFYFFSLAKQSTNLASISSSNIKETPLILPPIQERKEIMLYLKGMQVKYSNLEDQANKKIQLLQERRTALIAAAVTGKIDLRGWRAPVNEVAA